VVARTAAGWIGLDQYDERNATGRNSLTDSSAARQPAGVLLPVYCYDVGRLMMTALANARR
jgi:hypothetical protein